MEKNSVCNIFTVRTSNSPNKRYVLGPFIAQPRKSKSMKAGKIGPGHKLPFDHRLGH